jgi:hypothetical protein
MKPAFSRQIFKIFSNLKLHENPSIGTELFHADGRTDRRTDTMNLTVGFRNFMNAPKNGG